jgi:hypothetical protein
MDESAQQVRRLDALTWAFVALGIVVRLVRYGCNFPLWGDESFVAINFLARSYRALLAPLDYGQISAVLFLWIERWVVLHFGFSEWTLRLFPLACGVASVVLFRQVAAHVVRGLPLLLGVAIFAVSYHPIRHAAEVKPYASDLLVALVLLALALRWRQAPERARWLWLLVAVVPVALALSHPALFIAGGISLGLAPQVWRRGRWGTWVPFVAYQVAVLGMFLVLYAASTRFQEQLALDGLRAYWAAAFPPLDSPVRLLRWLIAVHTGTMLAYPGGGRNGASTGTLLAVTAGSVWLWRHRRRGVLAMLLAPLALALLAAALRRYPYGIEARQMQFAAPAICLLAGLGVAWLLHRIVRRQIGRTLTAVALFGLAGCAIVSVASDLRQPYRFPYDYHVRQFARRFWREQASRAELACLYSDFGIADRDHHRLNLRTAAYVCNQWIYSPQRRLGGGPRWEAVSPRRPLRCVLYHETRPDHPKVVAWLARMQHAYELRQVDRIAIALPGMKSEHLVVFEFVPRPGVAAAPPPVIAGQGLLTARLVR